MRRFTILLLAALGLAVAPCHATDTGWLAEWTMIDVSPPGVSGDANLLRFADGTRILIDTGFEPQARNRVLPLLRRESIDRLDQLVITHAHTNHYGGVPALLDAGIKVGEIVFDPPDAQACAAEAPWGCNPEHIAQLRRAAQAHGVPMRSVSAGDVLYRNGDTVLRVLYAFNGGNTPVGRTSINDTSLIMRLDVGGTRVLLAADLDQKLGAYLAREGKGLRADILKVPHHGLESAAPNTFFDRVGAHLALVPGPAAEWRGERGERIRRYFEGHDVPVRVNGIDGDITVRLREGGYDVSVEHAQPKP